MKLQTLKVEARKRAIGPRWGYEEVQPLRATHGIDIEREIECQLSPVIGPMKWKRHDDESAFLRCLFGWKWLRFLRSRFFDRDPIFKVKSLRKIVKRIARLDDEGKWWRRLFG